MDKGVLSIIRRNEDSKLGFIRSNGGREDFNIEPELRGGGDSLSCKEVVGYKYLSIETFDNIRRNGDCGSGVDT